MKEYRISLDTAQGARWFLVEANSVESARIEAESTELGTVTKIEESWEQDFDPKLHVDH